MFRNIKKVAHNNTPRSVVLIIDMLLAILSFTIACTITDFFDFVHFNLTNFIYPLAVVLIFRLNAFLITKSHTGIIKYTSTQDAIRIFSAVVLSTVALLIVDGLYYFSLSHHLLEPGTILIDAFILMVFMSAFRLGFKILYNHYLPGASSTQNQKSLDYLLSEY